jgi:hypothetical protein
MTQKSLKDSQIKAFIKEGVPGTLSIGDPPGLSLTLSKAGTTAWILRYRIAGKQKELTLGRPLQHTDCAQVCAGHTGKDHRFPCACRPGQVQPMP